MDNFQSHKRPSIINSLKLNNLSSESNLKNVDIYDKNRLKAQLPLLNALRNQLNDNSDGLDVMLNVISN